MENKENLCEAEVRKNLVLVELGEPLTLPLATLNRSCKFRREWMKIQDKWHGRTQNKVDGDRAYEKTDKARVRRERYYEKKKELDSPKA